MTEVSFHTGASDPIAYACRLVRKAVRKGSRIVATAAPETLLRLDQALWRFDPLDFIAHAMVRAGQPIEPRLRNTPVWLAAPGVETPIHEVLVNLGPDLVPGFETYTRVIEIVGTDSAQAEAARHRWRHYKERGYPIIHHEVSA
jgi:DNA polymerase-3 subunit chi